MSMRPRSSDVASLRTIFIPVAAAVLIARLGIWPAINLGAASLAWTSPEIIALTGSGVTVANPSLSFTSGRAAAIWLENSTMVRAAFRPSGGPFSASQTLDTQTAVNEPSIAVGLTGKATAAWAGSNNPGPVRTVAIADLTAGNTAFGSPTTIFTSGTGQTPGNTQTNIDASGGTLVVFHGDGSSGYSRVWSAERAVNAGAFSVTSRTGNFEVGGLRLGASSDGAAFAYAWAIVQGVDHGLIGPRRNSSGTWLSEAFAYQGATLNTEGPVSLVMDGSDNAYLTADVCCNGGSHGPNFVRVASDGSIPQGAINPDSAFFGSASAPSSGPKVVVDSTGNAVMAWVRSPNNDLYAAYRAAGDSTTFSTPELVATSIGSTSASRYGITMDSSGNTIVVWKDACVSSTCTLKSKTRPAGASSTFDTGLTVATNVTDDSTLAIASDAANHVGVLWRDSVSPVNLKFSVLNTSVPDHLTMTSSTANLASGAARTLTAELRDAFGNVVTSDNSTVVTFAKTAGAGSLTGLSTATASSGIASKSVTGNLAGSVTVTASASGLTSGTTTFTVTAGAATHLTFTSATGTLTAGASRVLTAEIRDVNGNVVTSDSTTVVTFAAASGPGTVTGLGMATAASGVASKTVTGNAAGSVTISASASGLAGDSSTFTIAVGAGDHLIVTSSTAALVTGATRAITAEIRDASNNVLTADNSTVVTFAQTAGSGSIGGAGSATAAAGVASRTVTGAAAGSVTITASGTSLTSGSATFTVTAAPVFTDDPLTAGTTLLKAAHLNELRDAIAALRARYNLSVISWTDTLAPGTSIKAVHLTELRSALNDVYVAASRTPPTYTDPTITGGTTTITAAQITQLRHAVLAIW